MTKGERNKSSRKLKEEREGVVVVRDVDVRTKDVTLSLKIQY